MNNIDEIQNEPAQIEKLAAQRELYSTAKRYFGFQFLGSVAIPFALSLVSIFIYPEISVWSALWAICFVIVDIVLLEPQIKLLKSRAAKIQELFDSVVLDLPASPFRTAFEITIEEVLANYDTHSGDLTKINSLRNWYNLGIRNLNLEVARLICQRSSFAWASGLHEAYASLLKWVLVIFALTAIVAIAILRPPLAQVALLFSGLLPVFRFVIKQYQENAESKVKLSKLSDFFNNLWVRILQDSVTESELTDAARRLQDELFDHRSRGPLIPDRYYRYYRGTNESLMSRTGESLVSEFEKAHNSQLDSDERSSVSSRKNGPRKKISA